MKIFYIVLLVVIGFIIFSKLRKKGFCMPGCRLSKKPSQSKKRLTYPESLEVIRKETKKQEGEKK